jgi:membrane protease YdiL (CAAX protease family)
MPRVVQVRSIPDHVHRGVTMLFTIFALMLLTNVLLAWFLNPTRAPDHSQEDIFRAAMGMTVVEVLDTFLVLLAWRLYRYEILPAPGIGAHRQRGWLFALPLLGVLLAINFGYHFFLHWLVGLKPEADALLASGHYQWWLLALICIQPAIIEELFFRRLTFDFFCSSTSVGTAAFASAMMFAAAHTGGFLSLPYLALFGFSLAWLRWFTGSLALTMIVHGLHNLIVSLDDVRLF